MNLQTQQPYVLIPGGRYGCPHCTTRLDTVGDKRRHIRTEHTPTNQKDQS